MRLNIALLKLSEGRFLATLRVRGRCQDRPDILTELIIDHRVKLIVRDAEQILLGRGCELQANRGIRYGADISLNEPSDRLFDARASERFVGCAIPNDGLHQRPAHLVDIPGGLIGCGPDQIQHPHAVLGVVVHLVRHPNGVVIVRCGVDNRKAISNPPLVSVPNGCCRLRRVEADLGCLIFSQGERCEHTAIFQLIPAGLHVFLNEVVVLGDPVKLFAVLTVHSYKTVKHRPSGEHINGLCTPCAPDLQSFEVIRQSDAQIDLIERNFSLIIAVFLIILVLMGVERVHQLLEPLKLYRREIVYIFDCKVHHLNISSFALMDLVWSSSLPIKQANRLQSVWSYPHRSPNRLQLVFSWM